MAFQKRGNFKAPIGATTVVVNVPNHQIDRLKLHIETYKPDLPSELRELLANVYKGLP